MKPTRMISFLHAGRRTLGPMLGLAFLGSIAWAAGPAPHATVAIDGSADHRTIQGAIDAAPLDRTADSPWIILVLPGRYEEVVYVQREKRHVELRGADAASILTASLHARLPGPDGRPLGTSRTATLHIDADDFTVEDLTVENAAGPVGQALALRVDGDRVTFRRCRFLGHQDTILVNRGRHYFERCEVVGTTDFIFGGATAYFRECELVCLSNSYITAASTPAAHPYGLVFDRCRIRGATPAVRVYLGRPWRDHAAVLFVHCEMTKVIRPEGWHNWNRPEREQTARYAEFGNTGLGADRRGRVEWSRILTADEAAAITPSHVFGGADGWRPIVGP
jgi:pectinesterase